MNAKRSCFLSKEGLGALFIFLILLPLTLFAAPRRYGYDEEAATAMREIKDAIDYLRHELKNSDSEFKMFQERVDNQEASIASLRQQILNSNQTNKDLIKGNTTNWEGKIAAIESANKGLVADMKQLKTHANDTAEALSQYKQKISDLEKIISLQNQNIDNLQSAIRLLTEALAKEGAVASTAEGYRVKSGDSLEKIAKAHHTTIKAIKEANGLSSDRIIVGQILQIP